MATGSLSSFFCSVRWSWVLMCFSNGVKGGQRVSSPISCLNMPSSHCSRAVQTLMVSLGLLLTTISEALDSRSSVSRTRIWPCRNTSVQNITKSRGTVDVILSRNLGAIAAVCVLTWWLQTIILRIIFTIAMLRMLCFLHHIWWDSTSWGPLV